MPNTDEKGAVEPSHILDLIEYHAASQPRHPALLAPGRKPLDYRNLYNHITHVAKVLQARGFYRGDRLAVVLPEGPVLAQAIIAVSAVATCAPINPGFRVAEYGILLRDMNAKAVLVPADGETAVAEAAAELGIQTIAVRPDARAAAGLFTVDSVPDSPLPKAALTRPEDIALLLHTSGTTAKPKRVALTHGNVCLSAWNTATTLSLGPQDRCLNVMPLFHIHGLIGALLSSLAAGGSVVLPGRFDSPRFRGHLEALDPTWFTGTPTILHEIADRATWQNDTGFGQHFRFVRSASAPMPIHLLKQIEEQFKVPVIEAYGMTEGSHQISSNPLPPAIRKAGSVGIATGTEVKILDPLGKPLPAGQSGEIVIRGKTVICAYDGDSVENATAFRDGWLRTGDLGHLDEDGYLFIDGRLKDIINRGGEKVSPHEVEDVLNGHPSVVESGVFGVPHLRLGEDVAACVHLAPGNVTSARELQEFAAVRLADFKVPRQIAFTGPLPRSATGKLHRNALKDISAAETGPTGSPAKEVDFAPPCSETELWLAEIWCAVLEVDRVGADDSFFDLGGDSIQVVTVIARVQQLFGVDLSIVAFFDNPTIRKLAGEVDSIRGRGKGAASIPLRPRKGGSVAAPLSQAQQLIHLVCQAPIVSNSTAFSRLAAIHISGPLDEECLRASIDGIIRRQELLRANIIQCGQEPSLEIRNHQRVEIEKIDLQDREPELQRVHLRELVIAFGSRRFQLERDLLIRFFLVHLDASSSILLFNSHHLIFDGWSMRLFLEELAAHYHAVQEKQPPNLPLLPIQYTDFASWQADRLRAGDFDKAIAFWKAILAQEPPQVEFNRQAWESPSNRFELQKYEIRLDPVLTASLRVIATQHNVTLYMLLLAALKILISRLENQHDVIVLSPSAGRSRSETLGLIGNFVNILALRSEVSPRQTFSDYLKIIRKVCIDALDNEEAPFTLIINEIFPHRNLLLNPISPLLFQFKNFWIPYVKVGETTFEPYELDYKTEAFGLIVKVFDEGSDLLCRVSYNPIVVSESQARKIAECYKLILSQVANNPQIAIKNCLTTRLMIRTLGWGPVLSEVFRSLKLLLERISPIRKS